MRPRVFRPRRSMRIEVGQLLAALALPAAILHAFPYKALAPASAAPAPAERRRAACAFVNLDGEEERRIMAAAKSSWQVSADGVRRPTLEMFAEEIPEAALGPVGDMSIRTRTFRSAPRPKRQFAPPTDLRAPSPAEIAPDEVEAAPRTAFGRDDLLRLD